MYRFLDEGELFERDDEFYYMGEWQRVSSQWVGTIFTHI